VVLVRKTLLGKRAKLSRTSIGIAAARVQ